MCFVVGLTQGCYAHIILHICPLFTFSLIQHHILRPVLSVTDTGTEPAIVSKDKYLCLPPVLSWNLHVHCLLPLHEGQFMKCKVLTIEPYGVVCTIVPYIMFLHIHHSIVLVQIFAPLLSFDYMSYMELNN